MLRITYRQIKESETSFLADMLFEAIFLPPAEKEILPKDIIYQPDLLCYFNEWGKFGDLAFVVENQLTNKLIGCAWGRLFDGSNRGYGFINQNIPEISIALFPEFRNQGIGTKLLRHLIDEYKKMNYNQLSLSVTKTNPSLRLYLKLGFVIYDDKMDSLTMLYSGI